ncbi:hypothetical protein [Streptomyces sp. NPDC056723]|uniref:hypothetical protein n=1 Tax=Streptomyces sp. NPDC056723 TaxID=3345925 RepID=UPI0036A8BB6F
MQQLSGAVCTDRPAPSPATAPLIPSVRTEQLRQSIARRALALIGTSEDARILRVVLSGSILTVASEQLDEHLPYCIDSFRLPNEDETHPEQPDPRGLTDWVLVDQDGDFDAHTVDAMVAKSRTYSALLRDAEAGR